MRTLDHLDPELLGAMRRDASRVLAATPLGNYLEGYTFQRIASVFSLHPGHIGERITQIHVNWCPSQYGGKQKAFWITTADSKVDSWSFRRCFDRKHETEIGRNARVVVKPSIDTYRFKSRRCECCGCSACEGSSCSRPFKDVHHAGSMTFKEILECFLTINGDEFHGDELPGFQEFHDSVATLQALCKQCHNAEAKKASSK